MHSNASTTGPPLFLSFQFLRPFDLPTVGIPVSIRPLLPCLIEMILKNENYHQKGASQKTIGEFCRVKCTSARSTDPEGVWVFAGFQAGGPSHKDHTTVVES